MVPFRELYSGVGALAGRSEWVLVVHSADAWKRIAPSVQAQQDLSSLAIDWKRSVALVIRAPPPGNSATLFHLQSITTRNGEAHLDVGAPPPPEDAGPVLAPPVLAASLIVAEADAKTFGPATPVHLHVAGIHPDPATVAHER